MPIKITVPKMFPKFVTTDEAGKNGKVVAINPLNVIAVTESNGNGKAIIETTSGNYRITVDVDDAALTLGEWLAEYR